MATRNKSRKSRKTRKSRKSRKQRKSRRGGMFGMFSKGVSNDELSIKRSYNIFNINTIKDVFEQKGYTIQEMGNNFIVARGNRIYFGSISTNEKKYYLKISNGTYQDKHLLLDENDIIYIYMMREPHKPVAKHEKDDIELLKKTVSKRSPSKTNDVYYEYINTAAYVENNDTPDVSQRNYSSEAIVNYLNEGDIKQYNKLNRLRREKYAENAAKMSYMPKYGTGLTSRNI
jgi:hypothetical protein